MISKNTFVKVAVAVGMTLGMAGVAMADTAFGTSTASSVVSTFVSENALIIGGTVVGILSLLAGLTGLGWGVRKFRHYVSGRKF